MKMKDTTRRSVRFLFSIRRYLIFFLLMAFVITCCMILFLNMMTRATGFELTQEYIEQAAKVTFGAQPTDAQIYQWLQRGWRQLQFSRPEAAA